MIWMKNFQSESDSKIEIRDRLKIFRQGLLNYFRPGPPTETRGQTGLASRGSWGPVSVGCLAIDRTMNGHRDVHVPEHLEE
jgi:hypothetical protein